MWSTIDINKLMKTVLLNAVSINILDFILRNNFKKVNYIKEIHVEVMELFLNKDT